MCTSTLNNLEQGKGVLVTTWHLLPDVNTKDSVNDATGSALRLFKHKHGVSDARLLLEVGDIIVIVAVKTTLMLTAI